jgi:transcriptional regulator with XRE-family HTH domain
MVVVPEGIDPIDYQRRTWGENIDEALRVRGWSRKRLENEVEAVYEIKISQQSLSQWISGKVAPNPLFQAAIAGALQVPHHLLFPPIALPRKRRS